MQFQKKIACSLAQYLSVPVHTAQPQVQYQQTLSTRYIAERDGSIPIDPSKVQTSKGALRSCGSKSGQTYLNSIDKFCSQRRSGGRHHRDIAQIFRSSSQLVLAPDVVRMFGALPRCLNLETFRMKAS